MAGRGNKNRPKHSPREQGKQATGRETKQSSLTISGRRDFVRAIVVMCVGGGGAALWLSRRDQTPPPVVDLRHSGIDTLPIGNVTFRLQNAHQYTRWQVEEFWTRFQSAYANLVEYFGEELASATESMEMPILINSDLGTRGQVHYSRAHSTLDEMGEPELAQVTTPIALELRDMTNERVMFHELFHLLVQGSGLWPIGFREGHAHAVSDLVYGVDDTVPESHFAQQEEVRQIMDFGLDWTLFDQESGVGIPEVPMQIFAKNVMSEIWKDYITNYDPEFLRKFYQEIDRLREQDIIDYQKDQLLDIAEGCSPGFRDFYEANPALHYLGEQFMGTPRDEIEGNYKMALFFSRSLNEIAVLNIGYVPIELREEGGAILRTSVPAVEGELQISFKRHSDPKTELSPRGDVPPIFSHITPPVPIADIIEESVTARI